MPSSRAARSGARARTKRGPILLAVDRDPASRAAVAAAGLIAPALGGRVAVLHVGRPGQRPRPGKSPDRWAADELMLRGVKAEVVVRAGEPADEILAAARALNAALIVIGSRGRSTLGGLLLGSVSQEVTARADGPVLVARAETRTAPIRKILLAIEGVSGSAALVETAARLAAPLEAAVVVVHVSYPGGEELERAVFHAAQTHGEQAVSAAVRRLAARGIDATEVSITALGGISRAIARCADDVQADLILMGSHGPKRSGEPAGTELSTAVVRHTRRPVVVAREREAT